MQKGRERPLCFGIGRILEGRMLQSRQLSLIYVNLCTMSLYLFILTINQRGWGSCVVNIIRCKREGVRRRGKAGGLIGMKDDEACG